MQENHVNMQDEISTYKELTLIASYQSSSKSVSIWGILFTCQTTHKMQHTYVGKQHCHFKTRISDVNMQLSHFKI